MEQLNHIDKMVQYNGMPDMLEYKFKRDSVPNW